VDISEAVGTMAKVAESGSKRSGKARRARRTFSEDFKAGAVAVRALTEQFVASRSRVCGLSAIGLRVDPR
jgi:hypothetical protein